MKLNSILLRPSESDKNELLTIKNFRKHRTMTEAIWSMIHAEYQKILKKNNSNELTRQ